MFEIDNKLISEEIFEKRFTCDLNACKGMCCVEGDAGAPLEFSEIDEIESGLDEISAYMSDAGKNAIDEQGVFYMDIDNEPVTTLINGKECAFVKKDELGIYRCAIESAYRNGDISFNKPMSCHLYPIRISKLSSCEAINYHEWPICKPACACGLKKDVKVYQFLKEPLIRKYGNEFFEQLIEADKFISDKKRSKL